MLLRQMIWDPIGAHLRDATRVFVVPDGAIGLVPLAALPAKDTSYLLEHSPPISYLSAERDLAAMTVTSTDRRPGDSGPRRTGFWRRGSCGCGSGLSGTCARCPRCVSG